MQLNERIVGDLDGFAQSCNIYTRTRIWIINFEKGQCTSSCSNITMQNSSLYNVKFRSFVLKSTISFYLTGEKKRQLRPHLNLLTHQMLSDICSGFSLLFWYRHKITDTYMRSVFFHKSLSRANNVVIHLAINILTLLSLFLPLYCLIRSTLCIFDYVICVLAFQPNPDTLKPLSPLSGSGSHYLPLR